MTPHNHVASIKNLEIEIGQNANILTEHNIGILPSNTIPNPKEQVNAISLRRRREVKRKLRGVTTRTLKGAQKNKLAETIDGMKGQAKLNKKRLHWTRG